jgi:hypothetical protein
MAAGDARVCVAFAAGSLPFVDFPSCQSQGELLSLPIESSNLRRRVRSTQLRTPLSQISITVSVPTARREASQLPYVSAGFALRNRLATPTLRTAIQVQAQVCSLLLGTSSERDPEEEAAQRCCSRRCVTVTVSDVNGATWRTIPQTST